MISLGEALVNERKQKNVSLEEIRRATNISVKLLQTLEDNRFELLAGKFYIKSYLKSYLKAVGCDEKAFRDTHGSAIDAALSGIPAKNAAAAIAGTTGTTGSYYPKLRYLRFKKKNVLLALLLFALIIVLMFAFLYIYKDRIFQKGEKTGPNGYEPQFRIVKPPVMKFESKNREVADLKNPARPGRLFHRPANINHILNFKKSILAK